MNYGLSPPKAWVGVLRARCRLVSSKKTRLPFPVKDGIGPLRMPQAPPLIDFSDKITLQLPFIRIFQEKNNPFFVENLFNSV
jgi:hypothetical protein